MVSINKYFQKFRLDGLPVLILSLLSPLFFYKLGQSSLVSFDEAWYGDIARNILKTGNLFLLQWNGGIYNDHPPAGFWLIVLSEKIFGISEFSVRFAPALCGLLSILIIYFLGKELFNRLVGFTSAVALTSAIWFLFRSRSGNLDSVLTMFFLLTLLLAIWAAKNKKYLIPFSISLGFLFLIKTIVPLTIIPALVIIFWRSKGIKIGDLIIPVIIFLSLAGGWLMVQIINQPDFLNHYLNIGLPGVKTQTSYSDNFNLIKGYLHNGIGKWFWPGLVAIILGPVLKQKRFLILTIFFLTFFIPFIFSAKGHIWHLIPLYPILILAAIGFFYTIMEKFIKNKWLLGVFLLIPVLSITYRQDKQNWFQFIDLPKYISDEAILSGEASKYNEPLFIDGDFLQSAIFYSQKNVKQISRDELKAKFNSQQQFLIITYQWRLDEAKINNSQYNLIKKDRDKLLLQKI